MQSVESATGAFVWYDLFTTDPAAAQEFYGKVAGWGTQAWDSGMPYTMWMNGDDSIGGVSLLSDEQKQMGAPPHWLAYICVPDTDASANQAVELGGRKLAEPFDIPSVGRACPVMDPSGGVFALCTPAGEAPGQPGAAPVGQVSWHELMSGDGEEAWDFYSALVGWEVTSDMDMGPAGMYRMYGQKGSEMSLGGIMTRPAEMPVSAWVYYIRVADLEAALEAVKANGGQVMNGPMEVPGGDHVAQCVDPQGAMFALHHST